MSGIYIKGMEMPKSCNECRFFVDAWCYALEVDDWRNAYNKPHDGKRLDGCPLIPVPDHGRLLKVLKTERECVSRDCDRNCGKCDLSLERDEIVGVYDALIAMLDPADKEGEG